MQKKVTIYSRKDSPNLWLKWRQHGKAQYKNTGTSDRAKAEAQALVIQDRLNRGDLEAPSQRNYKFESMAKLLFSDYEIGEKKSIRSVKHHVANLRRAFQGMSISTITASLISQYVTDRKEEGAKNATINRELSALRRMINLAVRNRKISLAQVPYIPRLKEHNVKKGFFVYEDFLVFRENLIADGNEWLARFVTFGYYTGWRLDELKSRTFNDLHPTEQGVFLILNEEDTKNEEPRKFPLGPELQDIIDAILSERERPEGLIFLNGEGNPIRDFRQQWNEACVASGLGYGYKISKSQIAEMENRGYQPGPTFHDFRRSTVRELVRSGVRESIAMKLTGHKTRSVFERYNIGDENDLMEAVTMRQQYLESRKGAKRLQMVDNQPAKNNDKS
jgi:integrase